MLVLSNSAVAQTLIVRSGEHEGFTRVAVQLPENSDWNVKKSLRFFTLKIGSPSIHFDVSEVFNRIPRNRLLSVHQETLDSKLVFTLGCACLVSSFVNKTGLLSIDIKDNTIQLNPMRQAFEFPPNQASYRFPIRTNMKRKKPLEIQEATLLFLLRNTPDFIPTSKPSQKMDQRHKNSTDSINMSEKRLLEQIGRAATQGAIELETDLNWDGAATPHIKYRNPESGATLTRAKEDQLPTSLSATTIYDLDLSTSDQKIDYSPKHPSCFRSDEVALKAWGGRRPFAREIGQFRSQLFDELGKVRPTIAVKLSRAYLYFGFGREAKRTIELISNENDELLILKALSHLLDSDEALANNPFSGQQYCDGDVSFWAVISEKEVADNVNINAVQLAFSRLPRHLRSHFGAQVSQKFSESGNSRVASLILRAIERPGIETASGMDLAKAALAELRGDADLAKEHLESASDSRTVQSPKALVKLIATKFNRRETVSPNLIDLVASYALEFRKAPIGADLRNALAVALALSGNFSDAFSALTDLEKRDGLLSRHSTWLQLLALTSERADNVTFLKIALRSLIENPITIPAQIGIPFSRRLLDLGFPDQAEKWISALGKKVTAREQRLMRAEIALMRRQPHSAKVELLGMADLEATRLRAEALQLEGNYQLAGKTLLEMKDFDAAARGFWLSGKWEETSKQASSHYEKIVTDSIYLRAPDTEAEKLSPLAEARALLLSSSSTREGISDFLQLVSTQQNLQQQ
jgi:hypothetical protein